MRIFKYLLVLSGLIATSCNQESPKAKQFPSKGNINVAVLLYPGVELLDFSGPAEVFSNANGFSVYTVSAGKDRKVTTKNGTLKITADYTVEDAPQPEIIVVPGAPMNVIDQVTSHKEVMSWLKTAGAKTQMMMSVCTGAEIIGKAGYLDHKSATTHQAALDTLQSHFKLTHFVRGVRFVEDGKLLSTAGVSAGIDGALHVVAKMKGLKEALYVTLIMQYDKWKPEDGLVIGAKQTAMMGAHQKADLHDQHKQEEMLTQDSKDEVCGMMVKKGITNTYRYQGKLYGFCSPGCRKLFIDHPEAYIK